MIIGEAPGKKEDEDGEPFVGKAGHLLDDILDENGISREDVYITNAVHCRPPDNKTPTKAQIRDCRFWLELELAAVQPKYVLLLGNVALESISGQRGIRKFRGMPFEQNGVMFFPAYHPSYILHDPRQDQVLRTDIRSFKKMVDRGGFLEEAGLNYKIVNEDNIDAALADIAATRVVSVDSETSGLDPYAPGFYVASIGVGTKTTQWTFPLNHTESPIYEKFKAQRRLVRRIAKALKKGVKKVKVMQNGKFDTKCIWSAFRVWIDCDFDTMLAHYNLDENSRHDLSYLSQHYFDAPNYDIPLAEKQGYGPIGRHCKYLGLDCFYTRKLYFLFKRELRRDTLTKLIFDSITMPVARMYAEIENHGIYVDPDELERSHAYWERKERKARRKLDALFPSGKEYTDKRTGETRKGINWLSPMQVGEVLFDRLGLPVIDQTAGGKASTSESVLLQLSKKHEVPQLILDLREANKNLSTFIEPWLARAYDNRIHPDFKVHGTVTGRPSCKEPNLQQTPRNPLLRKNFTAPPGRVLIDADESQVELRLTADASKDPELLLCYQTGVDVHTRTVQRIIGIAKPDKEERKKGKAINFGFIYGMWWKKFIKYGLDNYGVVFTPLEAQNIRKGFFRLYKGLPNWHKRQKNHAREHGFVRNRLGRKRRLPVAMSNEDTFERGEAERQAINSPIQSLASDITLMAALQIHHRIDHNRAFIVGTVHDSILVECDEDYVDECCRIIKDAMERPWIMRNVFKVELAVPLVAEIEIGPWGDHENNTEWKEAA